MVRQHQASGTRRPPQKTADPGRWDSHQHAPPSTSSAEGPNEAPPRLTSGTAALAASDAAASATATGPAGPRIPPAPHVCRPEVLHALPPVMLPQSTGASSLASVRPAMHATRQQQASTGASSATVSITSAGPQALPGVGAIAGARGPITRIMSSSSIADGRPPTPKRRWRFAVRLRPFRLELWRPHTDSPRDPEPLPRDSNNSGLGRDGVHSEDPADAQVHDYNARSSKAAPASCYPQAAMPTAKTAPRLKT